MLSANASISSVEDWVAWGGGGTSPIVANGSGECRSEWAVARDPGPEVDDEEDDEEPFLEDFVERAPPRNREARITLGASPGNQGLRQAQQKGVLQVAQAK